MRRPSFQFCLSILLFAATFLTGLGVTFLNYNDGKRTIRELSDQFFSEVITKIFSLVKVRLKKVEQVGILKERISKNFLTSSQELRILFYDILNNFPELTYISMGDVEGTGIAADYTKKELKIREWTQQGGGISLMKEYIKDPESSKLLLHKQAQDTHDPRKRPWYQIPKKAGKAVWPDPFIWLPDKVLGITFAIPSYDEKGEFKRVFTVDIQLDFISQFLKEFYRYQSGSLFIVNDKGTLIAHNKSHLTHMLKNGETTPVNTGEVNDPQTRLAFSEWVKSGKRDDGEYFFEGQRFLLKSKHLNVSKNISWHILMSVSEEELLARALGSLYRSILFSLLILFAIIFLSLLINRHLTKSFNRVFREMEDIFYFSLEQSPRTSSYIYEMDRISTYLANIKSSLKSFKKYLSPILVKKYLLEGVEAVLGGEEKEVTVMFIDIQSYTKISESLSTEELIQMLNKFSMIITKNIDRFGGTVDKFIGDSIMAFWGGIKSFEDHALLACQCALRCCEDIKNSDMGINIRIGINTGKVIIGNFGSEERFNFTVLGDNVNQASRLESSNKVYKTDILISEMTFFKVEEKVLTRKIDHVVLKGRKGVTSIYEVLDFRKPEQGEMKNHYERALGQYQCQDWQKSIQSLNEVLNIKNDDGPALVLKERCQYYCQNPPPKDWDGVFFIKEK